MEGPSGVSPQYLYVLTTNFHCPLYRVAAKFLKELQVPHPRCPTCSTRLAKPQLMEGPSGVSRQYLYVLTTNFHYPRALLTELRTLADCLQDCHSVEDVTAVLREQAQDFKKFQEKDKVLKPLKRS